MSKWANFWGSCQFQVFVLFLFLSRPAKFVGSLLFLVGRRDLLSDFDRRVVKSLREANVLADVKPELLDWSTGAIWVPCPDGDQFHDRYMRMVAYWVRFHQVVANEGTPPPPRIHPVNFAGGALNLPTNSPLIVDFPRDEAMFFEINVGYSKKGIRLIVVEYHGPCGRAGDARICFATSTELILAAKTRTRERFPDCRVVAFAHVDYNGATSPTPKKNTYFLDRAAWHEWVKSETGIALLQERERLVEDGVLL